MDLRQFKTQCPHCLEIYQLSESLLGRTILCPQCSKSFVISAYKNASKSQFKSDTSYQSSRSGSAELSQATIAEFARRFPNPPQGVWPVGELLLDGMCQVLPFSKDKLYAEGGVGVVQRVRRRDWNVDLIIKSPKPGVILTEFGKESFERECQTWIELGLHANIVSCYFVRRIDGIPRLFAELAPDGTLNDWINDKRLYAGNIRESLARILDASIQFAWGLEHAHRQGLLHLDVKPSNVMTSGSTIKVTDFGLSKFVSESAESNEFVVSHCEGMTPSYCSPEQFQAFRLYRERKIKGIDIDVSYLPPMTKQSDIWSWAISILAMFHGRSPCKKGGQTAAKVFEVFLRSQGATTRPSLPQGMKDLLHWCFREKPEDRPESMQVIADQLVQIYNDEIGVPYSRRQPQNTAQTAESFSNRAISLLDLGKTEEALELLQKASLSSPNQPQIVFNQSLALWRLGKVRDSQVIQRLQDLTQNRANDSSSFYVFGLAHLERGNLKSCIEAFKHGLDIAPQRNDLRHSLDEANELLPFASQCIMQYTLHKNEENETPALYVEETGDFLLVQLNNQRFALLKVSTGQTLASFIPKVESHNRVQISAVSEDYKWNLTAITVSEIVVSRAALKENHSSTKSPKPYRFIKQDWGILKTRTITPQNVFDASPSKLHDIASSLPLMSFVPDPNGITIKDHKNDSRQRITENEQTITALSVSSDAKWLVIGGDNSIIRIWEVNKKRCIRTFHAVGGVIEALWFDPNKNVVVSLAKGNILQIWSVALICKYSKKIHAPHLLCLINSSEELQERQTQFENAYQNAKKAADSNNRQKLFEIYASVRRQEGWKSERSRFEPFLEQRIPRSNLDDVEQTFKIQAHDDVLSTLDVSWDGSFFVSAGKDRAIRLWSAIQQSHLSDENVNSSKFPTRHSSWKQTLELNYHYDWIRTIALSPNNRFLVSGGWDQTVVLWDLASGKKLRTLPEKIRNLTKIVFAPDGRTIATGTANGITTLWDLATNEALLRLNVGDGYTRALTFSRDGRFFVTVTDDSIVRLWNGRSQLPFREIAGFSDNITTLALTSDGNKIVVGCNNGKIHIIELSGSNDHSYKTLSGHLGEVNVVKLFNDGNWLVSTGKDKTIRFWSLQKEQEVYKITSVDGEFCDLALDFSGLTLIAGSEAGVIRCWNLFWEYELDVPQSFDAIKHLIVSLSAYYAMCLKLSEGTLSPSDYYTLNTHNYIKHFSDAGSLTQDIIQKIYTEMKYRGFHNVTLDYVKEVVTDLWKDKKSILV